MLGFVFLFVIRVVFVLGIEIRLLHLFIYYINVVHFCGSFRPLCGENKFKKPESLLLGAVGYIVKKCANIFNQRKQLF